MIDSDGKPVDGRRGEDDDHERRPDRADEEPLPQCEVCGGPGPDDSRFTCDWCERVCGQCCAVVDALLPTCVECTGFLAAADRR